MYAALLEQKYVSEVEFYLLSRLYEDLPHTSLSGLLLFAPAATDIINSRLHNRKDEVVKAFNYERNRKITNSQVRKAHTYAANMQTAAVPVYKVDTTKKNADLRKDLIAGIDHVIDEWNNR